MKKVFASLLFVLTANATFAAFMCDDATNYKAIYDINSYTCNSGDFLPANYDNGCVTCPANATCNGGTFVFNPNSFQGLNIGNSITGATMNNVCADNLQPSWRAIYIPNQHTCAPGYYMPANTDGCVVCPENSYCAGGTYTFNETTAQGIVACASGLFAPTGMWEPEQCGRVLHVDNDVIYLRSTKKTTHAIHFDMNHDGTADYFANMTTAAVPMHAGSTRKLKVQFGGQTYSVHDDTVTVP